METENVKIVYFVNKVVYNKKTRKVSIKWIERDFSRFFLIVEIMISLMTPESPITNWNARLRNFLDFVKFCNFI